MEEDKERKEGVNKEENKDKVDDEEEEEEDAKKFQTIVGKQATQALRLSFNNISEFVAKMQRGENVTDKEVEKAQLDINIATYLSMLFSKEEKGKDRQEKDGKI